MNIKLSEWIIEIALYICYLLVVISPPFLYSWTPIETSKYLHTQYLRNWNKGYITDITLASSSSCPLGFELQTLGYWSGVKANSCLCSSKVNNIIQFATDDNTYCNKGDINQLYNCREIPSASPDKLTKYKQMEFCIKRDTHIIDDLNKYLKDNRKTIPKSEYNTYFNGLLNKNMSISIDAIVDIAIAKTLPSGFPANNLALPLSDGYSMYIKKYTPIANAIANVYIYNDLIIDIHMYNELNCAYTDISSFNPLKSDDSLDYISYGGNEYCNNFNDKPLNITKYDLFYNDKNKRTVIINRDYLTDAGLSYNDIYLNTPANDYYSSNSITPSNLLTQNSNYLPVLVYQRYFYGLGCPMMKSFKQHLLQYENMTLCRNLAIAIAFFNIVAFVMGLVFLILKLFGNLKGFPCTYCFLAFLFMFMTSLSLILLITYLGLMGTTISYFKSFWFYCQIDYRGVKGDDLFKASSLEYRFIYDMEFAMSMGIGLLVITIITIIIHTGYYFIVCGDHSILQELRNNNQIEMQKLKQ